MDGILLALCACAVAAVSAGLAARAGRGASPDAWVALAGAALAWGAGMVWSLLAGGEIGPWVSSAIASGLTVALVLLGMLWLHGAPTRVSGQARTVVDGLIVAGSALFIALSLGLTDIYAAADDHERATLIRALADLTLIACALVLVTRCRPAARARLGLIAAGFGALAIADAAHSYSLLDGSVEAVNALTVLWAVGWTSIAAAAAYAGTDTDAEELEPGLPGHASVFVPSAPFAIAIAAAAYAGAHDDFHGALIWTGAAVIVLIVMRQVLALVENISYWRHLEAKVEARTDELRLSEARFRSLVTNSSDAIVVVAKDGSVRYQSPSTRAVLGYTPEELTRASVNDLVHPEDAPRVLAVARELSQRPGSTESIEFRLRHRNQRWRVIEATASNLLNQPAVGAFVVNSRDITERKALEEQLTQRAFEDPLTGLANRALFANRLGHALRRSGRARDNTPIGVLFLDLDEFKKVNDSFGHAAGDELLVAVAGRLKECVRPGDTVARLSGDEFAVLVENMSQEFDAVRLADRMIERLEQPIDISGTQVFMRASIGISTSPSDGDSVEDLLRNADVAMYSAKAQGKGLCEVFEPSMHASLVERLALERDLREALEQDEFELLYQPIVSIRTGRIRALEALVRWRHPDRGLVTPGSFIHLAEDTGVIVPIGQWVLAHACAQARAWQEQFRMVPPLNLAVNVSARQLDDPGLIDTTTQALRESRLPPSLLMLEITESVFVEENDPAIERLQELRALGVQVAIDDFGTGYSSLGYLRRLPIDILKIDRSFVEQIQAGAPEAPLAQAIISMSHSLGLTPVAEGIEHPEQAAELEGMGCSLAQGFYFAHPLSADQIDEILAAGAVIEPRGAVELTEAKPAAA